ncbi:hypothetical protein LTSEHVI_3530 [Salmonella enterica subsp. enterica serovar Hvittingfoss str. A4-620]|nr:hypothetical protein LTSEHVI_3530 [Salmonella enterica subsp. enterica serovar Hvittingfoss str. A4-620]
MCLVASTRMTRRAPTIDVYFIATRASGRAQDAIDVKLRA